MPMSKLEAYLTADMMNRIRYLKIEGLIYHFKRVSAEKNPYLIVRAYCIKDSLHCRGNISCSECWELSVSKVLNGGNPVL